MAVQRAKQGLASVQHSLPAAAAPVRATAAGWPLPTPRAPAQPAAGAYAPGSALQHPLLHVGALGAIAKSLGISGAGPIAAAAGAAPLGAARAPVAAVPPASGAPQAMWTPQAIQQALALHQQQQQQQLQQRQAAGQAARPIGAPVAAAGGGAAMSAAAQPIYPVATGTAPAPPFYPVGATSHVQSSSSLAMPTATAQMYPAPVAGVSGPQASAARPLQSVLPASLPFSSNTRAVPLGHQQVAGSQPHTYGALPSTYMPIQAPSAPTQGYPASSAQSLPASQPQNRAQPYSTLAARNLPASQPQKLPQTYGTATTAHMPSHSVPTHSHVPGSQPGQAYSLPPTMQMPAQAATPLPHITHTPMSQAQMAVNPSHGQAPGYGGAHQMGVQTSQGQAQSYGGPSQMGVNATQGQAPGCGGALPNMAMTQPMYAPAPAAASVGQQWAAPQATQAPPQQQESWGDADADGGDGMWPDFELTLEDVLMADDS
jgi:hypothetical protein